MFKNAMSNKKVLVLQSNMNRLGNTSPGPQFVLKAWGTEYYTQKSHKTNTKSRKWNNSNKKSKTKQKAWWPVFIISALGRRNQNDSRQAYLLRVKAVRNERHEDMAVGWDSVSKVFHRHVLSLFLSVMNYLFFFSSHRRGDYLRLSEAKLCRS